jgi:hypothetical protein
MTHEPILKYNKADELREAVKVLQKDGYVKSRAEYWELSKDNTQVLYCQPMTKKV